MPLAELVQYLDEYLRIREVPDERNAVNGLQVENLGLVGGIVAAVDASQATIDGVDRGRPRTRRRVALAAGASRTVLGRQRPDRGPAISPRRGAARARRPGVLRPHSARPPSDRGQQHRARRAARARRRGLVRRLQGRADRRLGPAPREAGAARRAAGGSRITRWARPARAHGSSRADRTGSPGSASSRAAPGT